MTDDLTKPIETPIDPPTAIDPTATEAPAPQPIATAPAAVAPAAAAASGGSRTRWGVAIVVAGLAIAATIGAVILFGQQATPSALQYIPGDAAIVAEIRLDLPGDQMQHLGNLLAHFPGFADQSTLPAKLDEALTKLVQTVSDGKANYVADLKPWVNGPLFIATTSLSEETSTVGPKDMIISATTNGAVTCTAAFKDQAVTHETIGSLDLVLSADGSMGCVVDGHQALLGDPATVRNALEAKAAGTGMDRSVNYKAARIALGGDRLATVYVAGSALTALMPTASDMPVRGLGALIGELPSWLITGIRAEDDGFVLDYVSPPVPAASGGPSLAVVPATHPSVIAPMVPGDTLVFIESQGAGVSLQNLLTQLQTIPEIAPSLQMLDGLGGAGQLVGWIDDVGVAMSVHGTTPDVTVLLVAKDEAAAATPVASIKTLLALAGGSGVEVKDSTIAGVAVTTITITDIGALIPSGAVPGLGAIPVTGPISFSIAARGRVLLVTSGEGAMTAILNTAAGSSLADNAAFKHAAARGIANARTTIYLGVGASVEFAKGLLTADELATYLKDAAPYVEPLEAFLLQATSDAAGNRSRMVITVKP